VKRIPILGGVLAALLVLAVVLVWSLPATAQPSDRPSAGPPVSAPSSFFQQPDPAPATPPRAASIDDLIGRLADIKAKKAALDKAEKETVALLKDKFKQQKERLKQLGVPVEDSAPLPCCTTGSASMPPVYYGVTPVVPANMALPAPLPPP
jgi:hypothetical protein